MPELPEVETIRRSLTHDIVDKTIKQINIFVKKQFIGNEKEIIGQSIKELDRKGKVLVIKFTNDKYLNIHLKLTGQLLYSSNKKHAQFKSIIPKTGTNTMPAKTTRIIITFTDNSVLFFNDLRKFGWLKLSNKPEVPPSPDILSKDFTSEYFQKKVVGTRKPIKLILIDQEKMSGIGNIYANDALFDARIHPLIKSNTLSSAKIKTLYTSIKKIIKEGIETKGSSAKDENYVLPDGSKGGYQYRFKVYQRDNQPCLRCKTNIQRVALGGRGTFFCPKCQSI